MTVINFAQLLQDAGPVGEPLPDGVYDTTCVQSEAKTASTGKPMIVARFRVLTGPQVNRVVVNNFVLTKGNPTALGFFFRHMAVFGLDGNYFAQNPPLEQVAAALVGRSARLTLATNQGRQNVSSVEPVPGGAVSADPLAAAPLPAAAPQVQVPPLLSPNPAPVPQQPLAPVAPAPAPAPAPVVPAPVAPAPAPAPAPADPGVAVAASPTAPPTIPF